MSAVTRWIFIRHAPVRAGGVIYGNTDVSADCSDARAFAALAAALPPGAVWLTSQLSRTVNTARAIGAGGYALPELAADARFGEQDFGEWHGLTHDALAAAQGETYHRFWRAPAAHRPPGGESFMEVIARVGAALTEWTARHAGRDIVCACHGGTIRAALAHALDLAPERALQIMADNLSRTAVDYVAPTAGFDGAWRVRAVNLPAIDGREGKHGTA